MKDSYSKATVTGIDQVGGLIGLTSSDATTTIQNCYSAGIVKATSNTEMSGFVGYANNTTFNNVVTTISEWKMGDYNSSWVGTNTILTEAQLKGYASTLGSAFKADTGNVNGGFPILSWQVN